LALKTNIIFHTHIYIFITITNIYRKIHIQTIQYIIENSREYNQPANI